MPEHFINILDHDTETLERVLARCAVLKKRMKAGIPDRLLIDRTLGMIFEKPSTRTRFSLETAMNSMGGSAINAETGGSRLGEREAVRDVSRTISRYVDVISIRTFAHAVVDELAEYASVPVVNALSDHSHPTQAMADVMTVREHLGEGKKTLVFVGDGNNVARSLAAVCGRLGWTFVLSCPEGYDLDAGFLDLLSRECPGAAVEQIRDPAKAVADADVVYTDVWASMGQEEEQAERNAVFEPWRVDADLMAKAPSNALVMHCLPAHRGEEITDDVLESDRSVVFDQAENRMHFYRGLFAELLGV